MLHKEDFGPSLVVSRPYTPSGRTYRAPTSLHLVGETPTKRPSTSRTRCRYNSTRAGVHKPRPCSKRPKAFGLLVSMPARASNTSTIWAGRRGSIFRWQNVRRPAFYSHSHWHRRIWNEAWLLVGYWLEHTGNAVKDVRDLMPFYLRESQKRMRERR
jgi:hypothetical protein